MPPIRSAHNRKAPPDGFDDLEDTLLEFSNKMKDAENASHEGKKRHEVLWPIFQITHQRMLCSVLFCSVFFHFPFLTHPSPASPFFTCLFRPMGLYVFSALHPGDPGFISPCLDVSAVNNV